MVKAKSTETSDAGSDALLQRLPLDHQHLFDMVVLLENPTAIGNTPKGNRQILLGKSGSFKGERLAGQILPWGADWFLVRSDGVGELDVRVTLRTDDDQLIYMRSEGFLRYSRENAKKVLSGSADPADYYFRERTVFETGAEKYYWLNSIVAVGTGWYRPGAVGMSIYEIR